MPYVSFFKNLFGSRQGSLTRHGDGHELVIGPLCDDSLFSRKARLYFCMKCKQRFLVCGDRYALLDRRGNVMATIAAQDRSDSLEQALCPARDLKQPTPPVKAFIVHLRPPGRTVERVEHPGLRRVNSR